MEYLKFVKNNTSIYQIPDIAKQIESKYILLGF